MSPQPIKHAAGLDPSTEGKTRLEVNVIFTTDRGALAALRAATSLTRNLDARIRFLVPQAVPYILPLDHPLRSVAFAERRCCALAQECTGVSEVRVEVFLCRDKRAALLRALPAHSVALVGGKKRWWLSSEQKLARMLQLHGHRVIFVDQSGCPGWTQSRRALHQGV